MTVWYTHRFNTAASLRMILTVIPRVPRWLVPPIGVATTAICVARMKREREAAARNLRRILGRDGWALRRAVWRLFYNFSRFMVSYCDLPELTPERLAARVTTDEAGEARIRAALRDGKGLIVLTAHLGNWEVGMRLLERTGVAVQVAMHVERRNAAERWLSRARQTPTLRVVSMGASPDAILSLRSALARNEILAMQGDRAFGARSIEVRLFGAAFALPLGPFALAHGCGAALVPAFVVQEGWWRYRSEIGTPIAFSETGDRAQDLASGARQYAAQLERIVASHPDQWFNFYDLWPDDVPIARRVPEPPPAAAAAKP